MNPSPLPFAELREQAIALRRAGKSRREIKQILGITSDGTITKLVAGERPPPWTARPTAKDDLRAQALELREQGHTYNEIAAKLGVSKSSVSLWVRHLPRTGRLRYEEWRRRAIEGHRAYWEVQRPINEARRNATTAAAAEESAL